MHQAYSIHLSIESTYGSSEMEGELRNKSLVFNIFAPLLTIRVNRSSQRYMNKTLFLLFILISIDVFGQGGVNSPFSRFGIGDMASESAMHIRQMGGIGTSYLDLNHLNFDNPASLSHLRTTGFDVGLDFKRSSISDDRSSSSQWSGNLGYLSMGFPLRNPVNEVFSREDYKFNWGMGFALMPNSTVSYDITRLDSLTEGQSFLRSFTGNGGSYKAMWSNSIKYGDFSAGLSMGWLFGNIEYSRNIEFSPVLAAFNNRFERSYNFRGFYSKAGLMYFKVLNKKELQENLALQNPKSISIGFSYKPGINISTESAVSEINEILNGGITDTLSFVSGIEGSGNLPAEIGFGATYTHGVHFAFGFDIRRTLWSNYVNDANPETLTNTTRVGFGGYWRPNATDFSNILNRTSYRFGLYFEQDPRSIESESINTFGITLGAGLPLAWQRRFAKLNLGLDIGKRSVRNILDENFVKVTFGFTFNESDWFIKRKFN